MELRVLAILLRISMFATPPERLGMNTVCVSVTYGRRWHLLRQAIASALHEGIARAIVVDNGSQEPIRELAQGEFDDKMKVIALGANTGSANGFKAGLEAAYAAGSEFMVLLDDDNVLEPGALAELMQGWREAAQHVAAADLAVVACRPEHQAPARGAGGTYRDSFFDFHVYDLPRKLWRRLAPPGGRPGHDAMPDQVSLQVAPYGGMFFHRSVLEKHGFPDPDLVLYGDDTEFSYRLIRAHGQIRLITRARITDLESSWSQRAHFGSAFHALLQGGADFRAYYLARNVAYFERHCRPHRAWMRAINRAAYLMILVSLALRLASWPRLKLLLLAIRHGERAELGVNRSFPLS